jgi:hypothetical protein
VSGQAPETERERQLRAFAARVLSWPDPSGPASVDLIPGGYPEELPPELVDDADVRFLGSVVRRRQGELVGMELLFEMNGGPHDLLQRYEHGLESVGWQRVNQPGLPRGGFQGGGMPLASTLVHVGKRTRVYEQSFSEGESSLLRVMYSPPTREKLPDDLSEDAPPGRSPLPGLTPPPGVRVDGSVQGGGGRRWSAGATAHTDMASVELEAYFARQLEGSGWSRLGGSADELFAWSSWLVPFVPPTHEWRGVLMVVAPFPGERSLSLWAEEKARR